MCCYSEDEIIHILEERNDKEYVEHVYKSYYQEYQDCMALDMDYEQMTEDSYWNDGEKYAIVHTTINNKYNNFLNHYVTNYIDIVEGFGNACKFLEDDIQNVFDCRVVYGKKDPNKMKMNVVYGDEPYEPNFGYIHDGDEILFWHIHYLCMDDVIAHYKK